jgi:hypothetical protein
MGGSQSWSGKYGEVKILDPIGTLQGLKLPLTAAILALHNTIPFKLDNI